jgi:hypothetical protein
VAILNGPRGFSRAAAAALILVLFVGGLPSLSGVTITGAAGPPAFTLDTCHPLPAGNHGLAFSPFPLNAVCAMQPPMPGDAVRDASACCVLPAPEAPDPPPPKFLR